MVCIQAKTAPSVGVSGTVQVSGLTVGGKVTVVTVSDSTWTPMPATPRPGRNALNMQNESNIDIKMNYDSFGPLPAGYEGMTLPAGAERQYGITDSIIMYAKAAPGSGGTTINVEELV